MSLPRSALVETSHHPRCGPPVTELEAVFGRSFSVPAGPVAPSQVLDGNTGSQPDGNFSILQVADRAADSFRAREAGHRRECGLRDLVLGR